MPTAFLDRLAQSTRSAVTRLTVKSALNPLLWLCGIVPSLAWSAAYLLREDHAVQLMLVITGMVPIALTSLVGVYFAVARPEKLQSEDYQLRSQTLQLIREKGGKVVVDPASLESIASPQQLLPQSASLQAIEGPEDTPS